MERVRLPLLNDIYEEKGTWKVRSWEEDGAAENGLGGREKRHNLGWIGPARGPERLTKKQAQRIAWENFLSRLRQDQIAAQSGMTVANFIETSFVPEHVLSKRLAGRSYYHAILKHVIAPEEVDRILHVDRQSSKAKLKSISGWPYLSDLRVQDCGPEHIERLISAALLRGYSFQTLVHIRNVVSAVFSHAIKMHRYTRENPARMVKLPDRPSRNPHQLTFAQAKEVLEAMRYPEKEMTLIAMLTRMNVAEICGLQWRHVNLTGMTSHLSGEPIPPITIAVRKRWYRGDLDDVQKGRAKNLPIPDLLLPMLLKLSGRARFTEPNDFVLVSRAGTPINAINITARRLRTIGEELQMPWLTWHVFRHAHETMEAEFKAHFHYHLVQSS